MKPTIGSLWQENDRRFTRVVEVIDTKKNSVRVKTVVSVVGNKPGAIGRVTRNTMETFLSRFHRLDGFCHKCQVKRGGIFPPNSVVTCTAGTCAMCLTVGATLVPDCDYDWPGEHKKAIWD